MQGRFNKSPEGVVYIGAELERGCLKMGILARAAANLLLAFCKSLNNLLHFSLGDDAELLDKPEDGERPHFAIPLYRMVDQFIVSRCFVH